MTGTLYLVGTPIGNLDDITFRAVQTLQTVDCIAAEDTRHTGKLLKHFQITTPQISYHEHNRHHRTPALIERLQGGEAIALVSDAGMPGISDPGYELVAACVAAQLPVVPIPGVTAAITALAVSGLPTDQFVFAGFLPSKSKARRDRLAAIAPEPRTLIFYESPHRLLATLTEMAQSFGADREVAIARELTKLHEEFWRGSLKDAIGQFTTHPPRGEFTLIVAGATATPLPSTDTELTAELHDLITQGMTPSQASRHLAHLTHHPRRHLYQLALTLKSPQ
ncbi:16S rRNA (cytidine(1402)-2'-O)-methyltransferase [Spirulina major]|uniref:16S rRNA (cytidine(1402)-2'-O)-methyltransferase n=1 Tax=Spirulina major TaxID=270636 RepID=UPI000933780D|nr:16S rRNA (cytidine(1402)-2'-O)-methyltransferase [Spirulina major]